MSAVLQYWYYIIGITAVSVLRKCPIRLTPQHMAMNLAYKIEISQLLENVDDFANNL